MRSAFECCSRILTFGYFSFSSWPGPAKGHPADRLPDLNIVIGWLFRLPNSIEAFSSIANWMQHVQYFNIRDLNYSKRTKEPPIKSTGGYRLISMLSNIIQFVRLAVHHLTTSRWNLNSQYRLRPPSVRFCLYTSMHKRNLFQPTWRWCYSKKHPSLRRKLLLGFCFLYPNGTLADPVNLDKNVVYIRNQLSLVLQFGVLLLCPTSVQQMHCVSRWISREGEKPIDEEKF